MKDKLRIQIHLFQGVMLFCFLVLLLVLARLQIWDDRYRTKAEATTLDKELVESSRGLIYDRNGTLMASNGPEYSIIVQYDLIDPNMDKALLCDLLGMSLEEYHDRIEKDWSNIRYAKNVPFLFMDKVSAEKMKNFMDMQFLFPGFKAVFGTKREYNTEHAAHALGYLNVVDRSQITPDPKGYGLNDVIGASGLEKTYEEELKGVKGVKYILKDKYGRDIEPYLGGSMDSLAQSGLGLKLGLDLDLQAYAEELLKHKKGAVVAIEPSTGEILALASGPSYDPALMEMSDERSFYYDSLQTDSLKPFFNRAIMAKYPPGSILKPILAAIALQRGVITAEERISCYGAYEYRHFKYGCHEHSPHVNLSDAIAVSCNSYFFDTYRHLLEVYGYTECATGLNILADYLNRFGLGRTLGVDLPSESPGFVPRSDYYDKLYNTKRWRSTYTISLGIGQGELQLTTLQMANLAAILANKGSYYTPHLVKSFIDGTEEKTIEYELHSTGIDKEHFAAVELGMLQAVERGTGTRARVGDIQICGKTGTSQNPHGEDHSVFFAYAPRENPEIAIAVYIENGGWGGSYAAPIAGLLIEKYLKGSISPGKMYQEKRMKEIDLIALASLYQ